MQLSCPDCGRAIPAADVNIGLALAKCSQCHNVFNFGKDLGARPITAVAPMRDVPLPAKFRVEELGQELTISWSWYQHGLWFLLFFCIFWDGFLVVWYSVVVGMMFLGQGGPGTGFSILFAVFPLIHVAVGIGLTYAVITGFLNRTKIRVQQGELTIRHGPIPSWGNHTVQTFDLSQLYVTEQVSSNRRRYSVTYDLNAIRTDGTKLKLLGNLQELDQALWLEQKLEQHLKIDDEKVPGEVGK